MTVCGRELTWMARPTIDGIRVVAALPEIVGDEHDRLGALAVVLGVEAAAELRRPCRATGNRSWLIAAPE